MDYETRALPLSYRNQLHLCTIRPLTCAIPQFQFWLKTLIKCIIKVVNVSKSQYYEFRHNIMNLGNQNSKYSWRIRDLENPQTGTQFANSVLMYKDAYQRESLTEWPVRLPLMRYFCNLISEYIKPFWLYSQHLRRVLNSVVIKQHIVIHLDVVIRENQDA